MQGSLLELGPRARAVFVVLYVLALCSVVAFGQVTPDHVFGFQMFNESSSLRIELWREVRDARGTRLMPTRDGVWRARDARGNPHVVRWNERVRRGPIARIGERVHASYGLDAQLFRLQHALDDRVLHLDQDRETRALVAVVDATRNGRELPRMRLRAERP
jgi:hypothetical protein